MKFVVLTKKDLNGKGKIVAIRIDTILRIDVDIDDWKCDCSLIWIGGEGLRSYTQRVIQSVEEVLERIKEASTNDATV